MVLYMVDSYLTALDCHSLVFVDTYFAMVHSSLAVVEDGSC